MSDEQGVQPAKTGKYQAADDEHTDAEGYVPPRLEEGQGTESEDVRGLLDPEEPKDTEGAIADDA